MEKINTEVFLQVVKTGSFKSAAQELGYTQAGISYIISAMENEIGIRLFIRKHGGVELSHEGKILLYYIEQIHNSERLFQAKVDELNNLDVGTVSVRSFNSVSTHWLPAIIETFTKKHPNIRIIPVSCENDAEAEKMVYDQNVDCGFLPLPFRENLEGVFLMETPLMASVSWQHPLAHLESFPVEEICRHPYIKMSYTDPLYLENLFQKAGGYPPSDYAIDHDYAALSMASKNLGYCIFPELMLRNVPFPLKHMPFDPPVSLGICIATRSLDTCSAAARAFIRHVQEWVKINELHGETD